MQRYMLDTNMASYLIKRTYPAVRGKLLSVPMVSVCLSAISEAELLFGVARRPDAPGLARAVREFLLRLDILSWTRPRPTLTPACAETSRSGAGLSARSTC
jgi:tRNA(fMet)-specific endonuclease VapC